MGEEHGWHKKRSRGVDMKVWGGYLSWTRRGWWEGLEGGQDLPYLRSPP